MIAGLCKVWARKTNPGPEDYWFDLPYAPRGYSECEDLVQYYEDNWGNMYQYLITGSHRLCGPKPVAPFSY